MKYATVILTVIAVASTNALAPHDNVTSGKNVSRRGAFGLLSAGAASAFLMKPQLAFAAAAKTGTASPFTGDYNDPNHPECLRQVKVVGAPLRADGTRSQYPSLK
jgi:hypothetical protein